MTNAEKSKTPFESGVVGTIFINTTKLFFLRINSSTPMTVAFSSNHEGFEAATGTKQAVKRQVRSGKFEAASTKQTLKRQRDIATIDVDTFVLIDVDAEDLDG